MARKIAFEKIKEALLEHRELLRVALEGNRSLLKNRSNSSGGDIADLAIESTTGEISSHLIEVSHQELEQVDMALQRMREGSYGKCANCDCNIPITRLEALPFAVFCIQCQLVAEESGSDSHYVADWSILLDSVEPPQNLNFKIN